MSGVCFAMFFVYFWHVSCVIPTGPPANGKSPKLMEFISCKPNSKFGVLFSRFYVKVGGSK